MDDKSQSGAIDAVFAALSDPTRRALLERMATGSPATPTVMAAELPITRQAVSRHLAVLEKAGLARSSVEGRERWYAIEPYGLVRAERWISRAEQRWAGRLASLKAFVEDDVSADVPSGPDTPS